jgi:cytochrome c peroxidase
VPTVFHAVGLISLLATFGCASSYESPEEDAETRSLPLTHRELSSIERGAALFADRTPEGLGGNGRACEDCHMRSASFQLSPADVEARFQALQWRRRIHPHADDPLFRPLDADDFRVNGESAHDYGNLRDNALIRISFPLPPNLRLIDPLTGAPSEETVADVWRAVPTVNDVKLTGFVENLPPWPCAEGGPPGPACVPREPNPFGGYQLDGRVADLEQQALEAFLKHAEVEHAPSQQALDDLANFENTLFSSPRVRAASRAIERGVTPDPDPDPPLDDFEQQGKVVFTRACGECHAGATASLPIPVIHRYGSVQAQCPRPVDGPNFPGYAGTARFVFPPCKPELARNVRVYEITLPDGTKTRRSSSDPGRTLTTGIFIGSGPTDDWQAFDGRPLRAIRKTAPYFHNNSAATLEEVLDHYAAFFDFVEAVTPLRNPAGVPIPRPPVISTDGVQIDRPFTPGERPALLAYLRKI